MSGRPCFNRDVAGSAAIILAARWIVRRFALRNGPARPLGVCFVALALLLVADFATVLGVRGLTLGEYVASRDLVAGAVSIVMLGVCAAVPSEFHAGQLVTMVRFQRSSDLPWPVGFVESWVTPMTTFVDPRTDPKAGATEPAPRTTI